MSRWNEGDALDLTEHRQRLENVPGTIFRVRVDPLHPLGFGYEGEARVLKIDKRTLLRRIREDPLLAVNLLIGWITLQILRTRARMERQRVAEPKPFASPENSNTAPQGSPTSTISS